MNMYRNGITLVFGVVGLTLTVYVMGVQPPQAERSFYLLILCVLAALSLRENLPEFLRKEHSMTGRAPVTPTRRTPPPPAPVKLPQVRNVSRAGYVYLTQSPSGYYKIGRTANPNDRMRTFSLKLPIEIEYIHLIETPNMFKLESELHRMFTHKRVGDTEFFRLDEKDIAYIKSL